MSVTFTFGTQVQDPEHGLITVHGVQCNHVCTLPERCADAVLYFGFCDHADAAQDACGCKAFDVNVSNTNASLVLERLGLPCGGGELFGETAPEDILGRALTGNFGRDDEGIESTTERTEGGATFIDCGVRPGYFEHRLGAIADLATEAQRRGLL